MLTEVTAAPDAHVRIHDHTSVAGSTPTVSIVVVTYGTGEIVLDLLGSIEAHTTVPHEVIVVDNPLDDPAADRAATRDLLRATTAGVHLVLPDENLGFGGGCNLGAAVATGRLLCFLNPDIVVGEGWLQPLVEAVDDPLVAVAAPALIDPDGTVQEAGQVILDDGCTMAIGGPDLLPGRSQLFDRDVDYASAACWVVPRVEHLGRGGFDERYHPAYFEDADYGIRVEGEGRVTRLVTTTPIMHRRGQGGGHAGASLAVPEASREVLRRVHADELAERLPRPAPGDTAAALAVRDRRAAERVVRVAPAPDDPPAVRDAFAAAVAHARRSPRSRISFVAPDRGPLTEAELAGARSAGLEVVLGDCAAAIADRRAVGAVVIGAHEVPLDTAEIDATVAPVEATASSTVSTGWRRYLGLPRTTLATVAAIAVIGLVLRLIVVRSSAGRLDADEAALGIETFEILAGRFPIVDATGVAVLEAYLLTPWVAVVGADVWVLKVIPIVLWAIAVVALVAATVRLVRTDDTPGSIRGARLAGVMVGGIAWVTPGVLLIVSTRAYAGVAPALLVTVLAFLVAQRVVDGPAAQRRAPLVLGVLAGLSFWMSPLALAPILPLLAVVLVRHRRVVQVWGRIAVGVVIGSGPLLLRSLVDGWPNRTRTGIDDTAAATTTYIDRLGSAIGDLAPSAFGLRDAQGEWMLGSIIGPLLAVIVLVAVVSGLVGAVRGDARPSRMLLPCVAVGMFPILAALGAPSGPDDARAGLVLFPFLAIPAAVGGLMLARWAAVFAGRTGGTVVMVGGALVWLGAFVGPHVQQLLDEIDGDPNQPVYALVERLDEAGITEVIGSASRVLPVEFVADRRLTAAVLAPGQVRFDERQRTVLATIAESPEQVAVLFRPADEDPSLLPLPPESYRREVIGTTITYLPLPTPTPTPGN